MRAAGLRLALSLQMVMYCLQGVCSEPAGWPVRETRLVWSPELGHPIPECWREEEEEEREGEDGVLSPHTHYLLVSTSQPMY